MTTVKQMGDRLNVSRVSIYSQIKKPEFKGHTFKDAAGVTQIDDVGQAMLEARYLQAQDETIKDIITDELNIDKGESGDGKEAVKGKNTELLALLQRQLETKDEQINNLLRIVSNQQQIQITHFLTDKQSAVARNDGPMDATVTTKPPSWYKRLFSRR